MQTTLFSTHARPILWDGEIVIMPRCVNNAMMEILTSFVYIKYTAYIWGMNVADQVRVEYLY